MGMRIQGSSSASATSSGTGAGAVQQRQQAFKDLFSALKSGDLTAAKTAFAGATAGRTGLHADSPLAQIGQALQSGDLGAAQQAGAAMQAARSGGHHHHGTAAAQTGAVVSTPVTATGNGTAGPGSLINLTA
jgi:hypothetical protein